MKDIRVNDIVRVHLGATVQTRNPKRGPEYQVQRSKKVKIIKVEDGIVTWTGSGAYPCTAAIEDVSLAHRPVML